METGQTMMKKTWGLIILCILIFIGLWKFDAVLNVLLFIWGIIFPFVLGGAIAFIINVPMSFIEKKLFHNPKLKKIARPCSLILTIVLVVAVIILVIFFLVPQLGNTFVVLGSNITTFLDESQKWLIDFTDNNQEVMAMVSQLEFNPDEVIQWAMSFFGTGAGSVMNTTFVAAKNIVSGIGTFFIAFSFSCYVLSQKEKLNVQAKKVFYAFLSEKRAKEVLRIGALTYKTFSSFLTGQCVEAVILGCLFVVALSVFGMPYAWLIGVVIAFTALIPLFGAFIGCGVGAFLIFMVSPKQALLFVILFLIIQQLEGNLIYPHVVGNSVGLPSIWVLAAVSVGGSLMGVVGMLIFIPTVSVLYTLFRELVYKKLEEKKVKL